MEDLVKGLEGNQWSQVVEKIELKLQPEIHGSFISKYRNLFNDERQNQLDSLRVDFIKNTSISNLDDQINQYTLGIKKTNDKVQNYVNYELINYINKEQEKYLDDCPNSIKLVNFIFKDNDINQIVKSRLNSIFTKVVLGSSKQSDKSNAGQAGEEFVGAMLEVIGLREGKDYKHQHESETYSNTDFVFPYVDNYRDQDVQIFVAVQFSSNDRLRMVEGELKSGAQAFAITGNGLDASSKNLSNVARQILGGMKEKNHRLVCYKKEIERYINILKTSVQKKKKDGTPSKKTLKDKKKLEYFENYTMSFSEFAQILQDRFGSRE